MGKKDKKKQGKYITKVTENEKRHESDQRRADQMHNMEVKLLQNNVKKIKDNMVAYLKPEEVARKKQKNRPEI